MGKFQPGQSGNPNGRPRKAERYAGQTTAAYDQIAHKLPQLVETLLRSALRGAEEVVEDIDEKWVPARLVTIRDSEGAETPVFAEGDPEINENGEVCVERKVKKTIRRRASDTRAAQDLLDRLMGKPAAEHEDDAANDTEIVIRVEYAD